jgi:hypothetical protein
LYFSKIYISVFRVRLITLAINIPCTHATRYISTIKCEMSIFKL